MTTKKKAGKPSPTRTAVRKSPAPTKVAAGAKPAASASKRVAKTGAKRPPPTETVAATTGPLDAYIEAAAVALSLPVEPGWLPAIKANLDVTLRLGAQVTDYELRDEAEPAPVFSPESAS